MENRDRACLIKGRDFLTLPNLRMLCYDEGFEDFDIRYVGGLWVMLSLKINLHVRISLLVTQWIIGLMRNDHGIENLCL